jgi:XRE family transcriptional regulator, regulator of sulfur utilization
VTTSNQERQPPPELQNSQVLFGRNIRAVRDSLRLSREIVAERAGIDADYLGEIERGEKWPALWMTRAIARVLGVAPAKFFEFDEDKEDDTNPIDRLEQVLGTRTAEQQAQALRVIKAMFGLS